jgi:TolB-like protein
MDPSAESLPSTTPPASTWARLREHKVLQWSLAYLGAALALAHGQELLAHTYHWPEFVGRLLIGLLIVGFPIAVALAWYHGHKALRGFSVAEATIVSLLVLTGAGLLVALVRTPDDRVTRTVARPVGAAGSSSELIDNTPAASIAVVPFANLTGDSSKEYFSDGMAEELIDSLSQLPGLKVPSRTSSFAYKGHNVDIRRIAQDLGVRTVLEGSVRSAGERIRITAQLVDARSGYHLWSQSYDRELADIFKLQDELGTAIVEALQKKMNLPITALPARAPPTEDLEAYQLYLRAETARADEITTSQRIALLDQAIARDPKFVQAIARRAELRVSYVILGYAGANTLTDAEADARRAIELAPRSTQAHSALAFVDVLHGQWPTAEVEFRRALAADPADPRAHYLYAGLLTSLGQLRLARAEATEAHRLAPVNAPALAWLSIVNAILGADDESAKYADLALAQGSPRVVLGYPVVTVYLRRGRLLDASRAWLEALPPAARLAGADELAKLFFGALRDARQRSDAVHRMMGLAPGIIRASPSQIDRVMLTFALLGSLDDAYAIANDYLDHHGLAAVSLFAGGVWMPEMRALRKDPRFQAFAQRMHFIEYWKQYGPPDECDLHGEAVACR